MDRRQMLRILGTSAATIGLSPIEARALLVPGEPRRASRRFFTDKERETVTVLADVIIPYTDTPGAVEAGVVDYIEMIVSEWLNAEERDRFRRGLRHLDTHAEAVTGTGFADAGEMGQTAILTGLEAEGRALKDRDPDAPTPFFQQTRALVLHGYYTSEIGMREELLYEPFPDRFEGCVKVTEVTRAVPESRG
jgi:hypothetical protein